MSSFTCSIACSRVKFPTRIRARWISAGIGQTRHPLSSPHVTATLSRASLSLDATAPSARRVGRLACALQTPRAVAGSASLGRATSRACREHRWPRAAPLAAREPRARMDVRAHRWLHEPHELHFLQLQGERLVDSDQEEE